MSDYEDYLHEESDGTLRFGGARMVLLEVESAYWGLRRQLEALVGRRLTNAAIQQAGANGGAAFARSFTQGARPAGDATAVAALRDCIAAYQAAGFGQFEIQDVAWPIGRVCVHGRNTFETWMLRQHEQQSDTPICAYSAGVLVGFINALTDRRDIVCVERTCQAQGDDVCRFELLPVSAAEDAAVVSFDPDPFLTQQLNLLEILFDRMPMGIAVIDRDFKLRRFNPTWAEFIGDYTATPVSQVVPGANIFTLEPGTEEVILPLFERVFAGETVRQSGVRLESGGILSFWDVVLVPLYDHGDVIGILNVSLDATERYRMLASLRESEAKFRLLFERSPDAMLLLDGDRFIDCNATAVAMIGAAGKDELLALMPYEFSPPRQPDGRSSREKYDELVARAYEEGTLRFEWVHRRLDGRDFPVEIMLTRIPLQGRDILHASWRDISERRRAEQALRESRRTLATLMANLPGMAYRCRNEPDWPLAFASEGSAALTGYEPADFTSGRVAFGDLIHPADRQQVWDAVQAAVAADRPYQFTYRLISAAGEEKWVWEQGRGVYDDDGALVALEGFVTDFTERAAAQQRLEKRVSERTRELSTLLDVSQNVASNLELEPLLGGILDQLKAVVAYDGASILELADDETLRLLAYRGPIPVADAKQLRFRLEEAGLNRAVIAGRRPVIVPDVREDGPLARAFQATAGDHLQTTFGYVRSWMGVPLIARGRPQGMLSLDHSRPGFYTAQHADLVQTFANQVAVFIENSHLYTTTRQLADEARTLFNVQQAITSRLDPDAVLQLIAEEARRLTKTEMAAVYLLDGDELEVTVVAGDVDREVIGYRLPVAGSIAGRVVRSGQSFLVTDAEREQRVHRSMVERVGAHAFVIVPLLAENRPIGTITVANKQAGRLGPDDERVLTLMASGAVIALENARLYEEEHERRQVAESLRDILAVLNSSQPLAQKLEQIIEQARQLLGADAAAIYQVDLESEQVWREASSGLPPELRRLQALPLVPTEATRATLERRPHVEPDLAAAYRRPEFDLDNLPPDLRAWIVGMAETFHTLFSVPLVVDNELYGDISLYYRAARTFGEDEIDLAMTFGVQAALAIENARLIQSEQAQRRDAEQRRRVAEGLRDIVQVLNSNQPLDDVLTYIASRAQRLMGQETAVAIYRFDERAQTAVLQAHSGLVPEIAAVRQLPVSLTGPQIVHERKPLVVPDVRTWLSSADERYPAEARAAIGALLAHYRSYLAVPVLVRDEVYGGMAFHYPAQRVFAEDDVKLALTLSEQAALAIENARLRARAEQMAVVAERNRLARELHDAVTQTLFSASLIADVLPRIWERNQEQGRARLEELRELTRGALAEMRTLLLELRPATLTQSSLGELLQQLTDAIVGRSRMPVNLTIEGERPLPPEVQVALYRIAQESLNNVTKHAGATEVAVHLRYEEDGVGLTIEDNGRGFAVGDVGVNSLGLGIMRERAAKIDAALEITSEVGGGTAVRVWWPANGAAVDQAG